MTADGSGNYTIPSLTLGAYTITPSLSGYHFSPTGQGETISSASITGASFTAAGNLPPPTPPKPIIPLPFTKRMTAAADVFRCIGITSPQGILRTLEPDVPTVAALQLEYTQLLVNYQILIRQDVPSQQTVLFAAINNAVVIVGRLKATLQSMTARGDNAIVLAGLQSVVENALTSLQTVVASE
jgi:hypothetical protein